MFDLGFSMTSLAALAAGGGAGGPSFGGTAVIPIWGNSQAGNGSADDMAAAIAASGWQPSDMVRIAGATNGSLVQFEPGVAGKGGLNFGAASANVGPALGLGVEWRARFPADKLVAHVESNGGSFLSRGPSTGTLTGSISGNILTVTAGGMPGGNVLLTGSGVPTGTYTASFGPGPANQVYVYKLGQSGNVNYTVASTTMTKYNALLSWLPDCSTGYSGNNGSITNGARGRLASVMTALTNAGENPFIPAFVLVMETNDVLNETATAEFAAGLDTLITALRAQFPLSTTQFILLRAQPNRSGSDVVRAAQAAKSASDPLVTLLDTDNYARNAVSGGDPTQLHWRLINGLNLAGKSVVDVIRGVEAGI